MKIFIFQQKLWNSKVIITLLCNVQVLCKFDILYNAYPKSGGKYHCVKIFAAILHMQFSFTLILLTYHAQEADSDGHVFIVVEKFPPERAVETI